MVETKRAIGRESPDPAVLDLRELEHSPALRSFVAPVDARWISVLGSTSERNPAGLVNFLHNNRDLIHALYLVQHDLRWEGGKPSYVKHRKDGELDALQGPFTELTKRVAEALRSPDDYELREKAALVVKGAYLSGDDVLEALLDNLRDNAHPSRYAMQGALKHVASVFDPSRLISWEPKFDAYIQTFLSGPREVEVKRALKQTAYKDLSELGENMRSHVYFHVLCVASEAHMKPAT